MELSTKYASLVEHVSPECAPKNPVTVQKWPWVLHAICVTKLTCCLLCVTAEAIFFTANNKQIPEQSLLVGTRPKATFCLLN